MAVNPPWARGYLAYQRDLPNHVGKRTLLRLLLCLVVRVRPRPFAWRMENGALVAISPREGLAFAWTVGWTCLQTGRWEPHVERCIRRLLRPGDTAIDVGANLGYFTAAMAQAVGPEGGVWSFEPVPDTFERLRLTVALNRFEQVRPLPLALGDVNGVAEMEFDPRYAGSASLHGDGSGGRGEGQRVTVRRLDDLVAEGAVAAPRLIKIDVEGHEPAVLHGARRTITEARPAIVFEYSPILAREAGWTLPALAEDIQAWGGYRFFDIREDGVAPIRDIHAYLPSSGGYGADILALPGGEDRPEPPPATRRA